MFLKIVTYSLLIIRASSDYSIVDFGAIEDVDTNEAAHTNTQALSKAFDAANHDPADRTVLLPKDKRFYFFNVTGTELVNVTLRIEGVFLASDNITEWERIMGDQPPKINDEDHNSCLLITVRNTGAFVPFFIEQPRLYPHRKRDT